MHTADMVLGPIVWGVPEEEYVGSQSRLFLARLRRELYCQKYSAELRAFFFGFLSANNSKSDEEKTAYRDWLMQIDWSFLLGNIRLMASWKKGVDKEENPIAACIFGMNGEYERLFRCSQMGLNP